MNEQPKELRDVRIVLVETTHPGNIGAAARAMKNMGLTRLVLVNPLDFPHEKAVWRSASASEVVESARVVNSVDEAIAGCHLVIGTSARDR
ncbi:MAG: TrmH family RNA methyltransferase, partial [Pseudomonadales bacterium]